MKTIIYSILAVIALGFSQQACTYETISPQVFDIDTPRWYLDVEPIFINSCGVTGCHVPGSISPNLTEGNAYTSLILYGYVDVDNAEASLLYQKISTGSMKSYATEMEKAIILKWIQLGANED